MLKEWVQITHVFICRISDYILFKKIYFIIAGIFMKKLKDTDD